MAIFPIEERLIEYFTTAPQERNFNALNKFLDGKKLPEQVIGLPLVMFAVKTGDPHLLQLVIDRGGKINAQDKGGNTALHDAALNPGRDDYLRILLTNGADVTLKNSEGESALHLAALYDNVEAFRLLIKYDAKIDEPNTQGQTVLHYLAASNSPQCTKLLLLTHDRDPYLPSKDRSPINEAITKNNQLFLKFAFLQQVKRGELDKANTLFHHLKPADFTDADENHPVLLAAGNGHLAMLQWLITPLEQDGGGLSLTVTDIYKDNAVLFAASKGQLAMLQWLITPLEQDGGGLSLTVTDIYGNNALLLAAGNGNLAMLQWLITPKAAGGGVLSLRVKNIYGKNAVLLAASNGHLAMLQWLITPLEQNGGGLSLTVTDSCGNNALLLAASKGHLAMLQWLITPKAAAGGGGLSLAVKNKYGENAVLLAAGNGHLAMLQWLITPLEQDGGGLSLTVTAIYKNNALLLAASNGHLTMLQWLMKPLEQNGGGLSLTVTDSCGNNAVLLAAFKGQLAMLQWLIKPKAAGGGGLSLTVKNIYGDNAVLLAAFNGHLAMLRWLITPVVEQGGGLSLAMTNNKGESPIDIAKNNKQSQRVELLFALELEQFRKTQDIKAAILYGKKHLQFDPDKLTPLLISHYQSCLDFLVGAHQEKLTTDVLLAYQEIDPNGAMMYLVGCYNRSDRFGESFALCQNVIDNPEVDEKTKADARFEMASLILAGYVDVWVEDSPFQEGLAITPIKAITPINKKTSPAERSDAEGSDAKRSDAEGSDAERSKILTARAVQAYVALDKNTDPTSEVFKRRLDQILAENYTPTFFAKRNNWSNRSLLLFQWYVTAYTTKMPCREILLSGYKKQLDLLADGDPAPTARSRRHSIS